MSDAKILHADPHRKPHRVVIVGGGFAGLRCAQEAARARDVEITLVDRRNHHLFQPLLYQVATGGLSPAEIAAPIRGLLERQKNVRVLLGEAKDVDVDGRRLVLEDGELPYDTLVLATGSRHAYFGNPQWEERAPGLKTLDDATEIRRRILYAFEAAERAVDDDARRAWLTFVLVGAGPTGVELAGSLAELARQTLREDFRAIDTAAARILLVEGSPRVLNGYHPSLAKRAKASLEKLGVEVHTGTLVTDIDEESATLKTETGEEKLAARTVIWAAGVASSSLGKRVAEACGAEVDRIGRVRVAEDLSVPGHPEIFVLGDLAHFSHQTGEPLRGTADVAMAEGAYAGRLIRDRLRGKTRPPFRFRDLGKLAVIGRSAAIAELPWGRFAGFPAWLFWLFVHLMKLVDFENRVLVFLQWGWSYLTRKRSARLITGKVGGRPRA